jgi:hypothetical protein
MIEHLDSIDTSLSDLRSYLAPDSIYYPGKRGGPNYNKPRKLLVDVEELL